MFYCKMHGMFYVNDEPECKFFYTETIKLYALRKRRMRFSGKTVVWSPPCLCCQIQVSVGESRTSLQAILARPFVVSACGPVLNKKPPPHSNSSPCRFLELFVPSHGLNEGTTAVPLASLGRGRHSCSRWFRSATSLSGWECQIPTSL